MQALAQVAEQQSVLGRCFSMPAARATCDDSQRRAALVTGAAGVHYLLGVKVDDFVAAMLSLEAVENDEDRLRLTRDAQILWNCGAVFARKSLEAEVVDLVQGPVLAAVIPPSPIKDVSKAAAIEMFDLLKPYEDSMVNRLDDAYVVAVT